MDRAQTQQILAQCERSTQDFARKQLAEFFREAETRLLEFADKARNNAQQWQLLEVSRQLKQKKGDMEVAFLEKLKEGFRLFAEGKPVAKAAPTGAATGDVSDLTLVADERLEIELAQSSFARRAETRYSEALYALHQRLAILNGGKKLTDESSPLGPGRLGLCFEQGLAQLQADIKIQVLLYKVFEKNMLQGLGELYGQLNQQLIAAGILPNLRFAVTKTANAAPAPSAAPAPAPASPVAAPPAAAAPRRLAPQDFPAPLQGTPAHYVPVVPRQVADAVAVPDAHLPSPQYQQQLYQAIRSMQQGIVRPQGWRSASAPAASREELISVIDHVQAVTAVDAERLNDEHLVPCESVSRAGVVSQRLQQALNQESGKNIDEEKANTIDLVGMIFEFMLEDERLPDNVKSVLSYLHTPYLKIAFLDEALFAKPEHPARLLLNALVETGSQWVNADGSSQFKAFPRIRSVVHRLLMDFQQDLSLVEDLLTEVRDFNDKVQRNVELLEQRAAEKAEGEDRLKQVKKQVHQTVREKMDGRKLPSPVIVLLLHPWSEYLTFVLLRHGDASESWQRALQVIDDLLWTISPKATPEDRKRLLLLQEQLQESLKQGFNSIAYDAAKANRLLDAINEVQMLALQNRSTQAAPADVQKEIESTAVGREEAEAVAQQAVEMQVQNPEERELVEKLRMVEFGTWMEFEQLEGHAQQRLKIAWFNSKTLQYMLVNRAGKQAAVMSAVEIARHLLSKNARMISGTAKPFFERALENIFSRLKDTAA